MSINISTNNLLVEGDMLSFASISINHSYDLSPVNDYLYAIGMGVHHSGVEILGREYSVSISMFRWHRVQAAVTFLITLYNHQ